MRQKVYIETTIQSYLVSRPSNDKRIAVHQEITKQWWDYYKENYELHVSPVVVREISIGDIIYAKKRMDLINKLILLEYTLEVEELANEYIRIFNISKKLVRDVYHIAYSVHHKLDYLLTWNCKHLANAHFRRQLSNYNNKSGYSDIEICTPEELISMEV